MDFRLLGPLEVVENRAAIDVGSAKPRALLAVLLLNANRVVSREDLVDALWGERVPKTASKALQVYVSQLRKSLGRDRIVTRARGYELRVEPGELDLEQFTLLVDNRRFSEALRLRRGAPLADFAYEPFAQSEIARLEELGLACLPRTNARRFRAISCHVPEGSSTATGSSRVSREGKGHPPWSCQHRLASYWASAPAKRRTHAAASQAAACAGVTGREAGYCRAGRLGRRRAPTKSPRASARPSTNAMPSCGQAIVEPESDASTEVPIAVPRANAPGRSYASR